MAIEIIYCFQTFVASVLFSPVNFYLLNCCLSRLCLLPCITVLWGKNANIFQMLSYYVCRSPDEFSMYFGSLESTQFLKYLEEDLQSVVWSETLCRGNNFVLVCPPLEISNSQCVLCFNYFSFQLPSGMFFFNYPFSPLYYFLPHFIIILPHFVLFYIVEKYHHVLFSIPFSYITLAIKPAY